MAKNSSVTHGPASPISSIPSGNKSSSAKQYDGVTKGPAGSYKRTRSSNSVPEVTFDQTVSGKA